MIVSRRRGALSSRRIVAGATGSVGETIAPSTNPTGQGRPIRRCATAATATMVTTTSPTEFSAIGRRFARKSRREVKKAAP